MSVYIYIYMICVYKYIYNDISIYIPKFRLITRKSTHFHFSPLATKLSSHPYSQITAFGSSDRPLAARQFPHRFPWWHSSTQRNLRVPGVPGTGSTRLQPKSWGWDGWGWDGMILGGKLFEKAHRGLQRMWCYRRCCSVSSMLIPDFSPVSSRKKPWRRSQWEFTTRILVEDG